MIRLKALRKAINWQGHTLRENLSLVSDLLAIGAAITTFVTFLALKVSDVALVYALFYWFISIPLPLAMAALLLYPLTEAPGPGGGTIPGPWSIVWTRVIWGLLVLEFLAIVGFLVYDFFAKSGGT